MNSREIKRAKIGRFGLALLAQMEPRDNNINRWKEWLGNYQFDTECSDDDYCWLTCALALKSVNSGNFGVGSILVDCAGTIVNWGYNEVFSPYFRSDRHAEMVVVDKFEDLNQDITKLEGYTLYTSLESCPMCLARLIVSRISKVVHVAEDTTGGMVHRLKDLPAIWIELADSQIFSKANCSGELITASIQIFLTNAEELNEILRNRCRSR